jgi:hypothetical protein
VVGRNQPRTGRFAMWSRPQLGKGGSRTIEASGMWTATTEPWGSVVALAGLSSNCPAPTDQPNRALCHRGGVRHQSAHREQSNVLCRSNRNCASPGTWEHQRDRLGSVVGDDFHADVRWASSISSAAASRSAASSRASAAVRSTPLRFGLQTEIGRPAMMRSVVWYPQIWTRMSLLARLSPPEASGDLNAGDSRAAP